MLSEKWQKFLFMAVFAAFCSIAVSSSGNISKIIGDSSTKKPENNIRKFKIDITGEVKLPGVYSIESDKRVSDAIALAGGATDKADLSKLNLAAFLKDGQKIIVPAAKEKLSASPSPSPVRNSSGSKRVAKKNQPTTKPRALSIPTIKPVLPDNSKATVKLTPNATEDNTEKVNINSADKDALSAVPGMPDGMAERIIDYRDKNGRFKAAEDITLVPGLSESIYWKIADYITV